MAGGGGGVGFGGEVGDLVFVCVRMLLSSLVRARRCLCLRACLYINGPFFARTCLWRDPCPDPPPPPHFLSPSHTLIYIPTARARVVKSNADCVIMGNCVRRGHKVPKEGVLVFCGCVLWEGVLLRLGMAVLKGEKGRYQRADFVV